MRDTPEPIRLGRDGKTSFRGSVSLNQESPGFSRGECQESGIGAAVAGLLPEGKATIFKASNDLSRHYCAGGEILRDLRDRTLCRSRIVLKLPDLEYFLKRPISNHHVVCPGDHTEAIREFFSSLS